MKKILFKKTKRRKEKVKKETKNSLIEREKHENDKPNKKASKLEKCEDVTAVIRAGNQHPECLK